MTSMTGYAYEEIATENAVVSVEFKSVNSRFLDLSINLPPYLNQLESYFRAKITEKVVRGKVDVFIRVKELQTDAEVTADVGAAKAYYEAIKKVADAVGMASQVNLGLIINQPGVLNSNKSTDVEKYKNMIEPVFNKVLKNLFRIVNEKVKICIVILKKNSLFLKIVQPSLRNGSQKWSSSSRSRLQLNSTNF